MNQTQEKRTQDRRRGDQNPVQPKGKDAQMKLTSLNNMNYTSNLSSEPESRAEDHELQREVNFVIQQAMEQCGKTDERDLSLVEILKQFELIVEEDGTGQDSNEEPQIHPMQRSKIYLQLLKYKKAQEMQELDEINDSIDKYKSKNSSLHNTLSSGERKVDADNASKGQRNSFFKKIQQQLKQKKGKNEPDCQMIPEKLPQRQTEAATSKVSLRQGKKDHDESTASLKTTVNQISQVSLKVPNERMSSRLKQADNILEQKIAEEQQTANNFRNKYALFNSAESEQLLEMNQAAQMQKAKEQPADAAPVLHNDQYVTFSHDDDEQLEQLHQRAVIDNVKRDLHVLRLERIEEGPEELQPSTFDNTFEKSRQSNLTETAVPSGREAAGRPGQDQKAGTKNVTIIDGEPRPKSKDVKTSGKNAAERHARNQERRGPAGRNPNQGQAPKATSKYKREMNKQQSIDLLPKKKYVSLRPGMAMMKAAGYVKQQNNSTSLGRRSQNEAAESFTKNSLNKASINSRKSSAKSNEQTPSLQNSKSRSIGRRKLARQTDNQKNRHRMRSQAFQGLDKSKNLKKDPKQGRSPNNSSFAVKSILSDKSKGHQSNDYSKKQNSSLSLPISNKRAVGAIEEKFVFNRLMQYNAPAGDKSTAQGDDATHLHYFNKLQENLQKQLDQEYHQVVSQHPSITTDDIPVSQAVASSGLQNLNDFQFLKPNVNKLPEIEPLESNTVMRNPRDAVAGNRSISASLDNRLKGIERHPNKLSRSQLSTYSEPAANTGDLEQAKPERTSARNNVLAPNKDLLSIKSLKSQNNQTIQSLSSPTAAFEMEKVIVREHSSSSKKKQETAMNEIPLNFKIGKDSPRQDDQGSIIRNVVEFSENEEKSRWEVVSKEHSQSDEPDKKFDDLIKAKVKQIQKSAKNPLSKKLRKSTKSAEKQGSDVKKKVEFDNQVKAEQSKNLPQQMRNQKHRFIPTETDKEKGGDQRPENLTYAEPRVTRSPQRSRSRSKSLNSPRLPSQRAQDEDDHESTGLQASSSTTMHSPLMPSRKHRPESSRGNDQIPSGQAMPYHVRSRAVQDQIHDFINSDSDLVSREAHSQKRDGAQEDAKNHSSNRMHPKQQARTVKGILKHSPTRTGRPQQSQEPNTPADKVQSFMGNTSINQFKRFIVEQLKDERAEQTIKQNEEQQDLNDREEEQAVDEQREDVDPGMFLGSSLLTKSNLNVDMFRNFEGDNENTKVKDTSQMLVYALHYEVKLMRKAFQVIQANSLINQTQKLNYKISKQRYLKSLKLKALRAIHTNFINHYGHKNANVQAATLSDYLTSRKYLTLWIEKYRQVHDNRRKIEDVQAQVANRMKLNVFMEWQQIQLAHQLYKVQKETADTFWRGKAAKKAYLSIKYFARFSIKREHMHRMTFEHLKLRLYAKAFAGLKRNIQIQAQKKQRILLAFQIYDQNCQKNAFRLFRMICMELVVGRINRRKGKDFFRSKLQRICWNHWRIFKIQEEKNRLNSNLAVEFRDQVLMRTMFNNLLISNRIFKEVYNADRVGGIIQENRLRACFNKMKADCVMKHMIIDRLPEQLGYYYFAHAWSESYNLAKYSASKRSQLELNFTKKVQHYYLVKCFFTLQDNYESARELRNRNRHRLMRMCLNALRRRQFQRSSGRYKERVAQGKLNFKKLAQTFYVLKVYSRKHSHCKKMQEYLEAKRSDTSKATVLNRWHHLYMSRQVKLRQKELSMSMHRDRYITTYFGKWMEKYNKSQRKKYLEGIKDYYCRERIRNKIFTQWMQKVTVSIDVQVRERQATAEFRSKRLTTTFDFLKVYSIRRKRERLITQIIREKNESILAISALQTWRRRLHERMEKHELYGQVMQDRDIRIKDLVFWTLKLNVEQSKEQKVIEVAARSEKMGRVNSRINQGFSSQGVADVLQVDDS